ncbi:hypothetical protein [Streptomyces cinereoruber]|uniref:hypothetical protein n=1 Tax=Streptomyces cinereoruber TaxID=67260 RepID=UPI0036446D7D
MRALPRSGLGIRPSRGRRHARGGEVDALGRWIIRRFGRFAGSLFLVMIFGSLVLYAAGIYATS